MPRYTEQRQAALADDFTSLIQELGGLETLPANPKLSKKFDRIYRALSRVDEDENG